MGPRPPLKSATVIWFEGGKRQGVIEKILRLPLDQRQPFSKSTRVALRRGSGRHFRARIQQTPWHGVWAFLVPFALRRIGYEDL